MSKNVKVESRGLHQMGSARREAILEATISLLAEVGYHGLSMRDLARRVGISHPGVIYHFPSKESLVMAVIKRCEEKSNFQLEALEHKDPFDVFHDFLDLSVSLEKNASILELDCMLAVEASSPVHPAHEHFAHRFRELSRYMMRVFKELIDEEIIKPDNSAEYLANSLLAQWYGLQIQWLYDRENIDVRGLLTRTIVRQIDFSNPKAYDSIFASNFASPEVLEIIENLEGHTFKDLLEMGYIKNNPADMEKYGLGTVPTEILAKIIAADQLTNSELRHAKETQAFSINLLGKLVLKKILNRDELTELAELKIVPAEAVTALITVMDGQLELK